MSWSLFFRLGFWAALVLALVMAFLPRPPELNLNDKDLHVLAFGVLAGLAALGYIHTPLTRIGERLSFVGAMIELVQSLPQIARDTDFFDWVADTVAIAVVLIVMALIRKVRS